MGRLRLTKGSGEAVPAIGPQKPGIWFRRTGANRGVQTVSYDCAIGEDAFDQVVRPIEVDGQRGTALRFADARTQALLNALVVFSVQTQGFTHAQLRTHLAHLLGTSTPGISALDASPTICVASDCMA